jgi:hypothetical protein
MIVSASFRTDIPAYYGRWFMGRLDAGFARVANPYGGPAYAVSLRPDDVDGFVFWTRNAAPFAEALAEIRRRGFAFVVQHTVTGYPRTLEPAAPEADRAVARIRALAAAFGPRAVVWRYDPIVDCTLTPPDWHRANFARLAASLSGAVDEAVVSFMQPYRKTARNLDAAARRHGFTWRDPPAEEKRALIASLAAIAAADGMRLTVCSQPGLIVPGAAGAACIDAARLADIAGRPVPARRKGNRPGCLCHESRDIGAYESCAMGCAYCYAVSSPDAAQGRLARHDPEAESLAPVRRRARA